MSENALDSLKKPIKAPKPLRVLINGAATAAFYDLEDETLKKNVVSRLEDVCRNWREKPGVRFITSFDDDLFMVGDPRGFQRWSIYIIFEVDEMDIVVEMIDDCRQGDVKLHRYFTMTATLGRAFWPIEPLK